MVGRKYTGEVTRLGHRRCEYCGTLASYEIGSRLGPEGDSIYCCPFHMRTAESEFEPDIKVLARSIFSDDKYPVIDVLPIFRSKKPQKTGA